MIQFYSEGVWKDIITEPGWVSYGQYRVKPEPLEYWVPDGTEVCYSVTEALEAPIDRCRFRLFREVEGAKL